MFEDPLATERYIQKVHTMATTLARIDKGDFKFEPSIALEYLSVSWYKFLLRASPGKGVAFGMR